MNYTIIIVEWGSVHKGVFYHVLSPCQTKRGPEGPRRCGVHQVITRPILKSVSPLVPMGRPFNSKIS
jgi:hypothetical protein